jgi:hypothetical protein
LGRAEQRTASEQLVELGRAQRTAVTGAGFPGVAVYTGGDDLLAFCPAAGAITLAQRLRKLVDEHLGAGPLTGVDGGPVTASTAVLFAHMSSPLQTVLISAREALNEAKDTHSQHQKNRDALAVVALRRGGERARSIQPWAHDPVGLLEVLRPGTAALSGGLASQLERDEPELSQLAGDPALHATVEAELARLVTRRGGAPEHAEALHQLAWEERSAARSAERGRGTVRYRPVAPLLVARFLAQECG